MDEFDDLVKQEEELAASPYTAVRELQAQSPGTNVQQGASFSDMLVAGAQAEGIVFNTSGMVDLMRSRLAQKYDPNFDFNEEFLKNMALEYGVATPELEHFGSLLAASMSEEHAEAIAQRWSESRDRDRALASNGLLADIGTRMGIAVAEPANLGVLAIPGVLKLLSTGSRAARGFKGAGVFGTEAAVIEYITSLNQTTKTEMDLLASSVGGAVIGGGLNAVLGRLANDLTPDEVRELNKVSIEGGADADDSIALLAAQRDDSAGSMRAPNSLVNQDLLDIESGALGALKEREADRLAAMDDEPGVVDKAIQSMRMDPMGRLLNSPIMALRAVGERLSPEHVGALGRNHRQGTTATELQKQLEAQLQVQRKKAYQESYKEWAQAKGIKWRDYALFKQTELANHFDTAVSRYVRGVPGEYDAAVAKAGEAVREVTAKAAELFNEAKLTKQGVKVNPNYLPRRGHVQKIQIASNKVGYDRIIEWVEGAMLSSLRKAGKSMGSIDRKMILAIAKGYTQTLQKSAVGLDMHQTFGLDLSDLDIAADYMRRAGDMSEEVIQTILSRLKNANESGLGFTKHRLDIDETYVLRDMAGSKVLEFEDLFDTSVDSLMDTYTRSLSGGVALKKTLGIDGSETQLNTLLSQLTQELSDANVPVHKHKEMLEPVKQLVRTVAGRPVRDGVDVNSKLVRAGRGVRKINFILYMQQAGFASLAELAMPLVTGGWMQMLRQIPALPKMLRGFKDKSISDDTVEFLEEYIGLGADDLLRPSWTKFDDYFVMGEETASRTMFERGLDSVSRFQAEYVSVLGPLTRVQRRMMGLAVLKRLEDWTFKGAKLSAKQKERLADMGLSEDDLVNIQAGLKKHGQTMSSEMRSKKFTRADLEAFQASDPDTFNRLMTAIQRESERGILEATNFDQPLWMTTETGRLFSQLLSFAINAYTKLTLRGFQKRDIESLLILHYSVLFAGLGIVTQDFLNGNSDKTFENMTSPGGFMWKTLGRAGQMSLIPAFVDQLAYRFGEDEMPLFSASTSGRDTGFITGNPTVGTISNAGTALQALTQLVSNGSDITQTEGKAIGRFVPFSGALGARAALNKMIEMLPEND